MKLNLPLPVPFTPRLPCFPWWFPPLCHFIRTMQCCKMFLSFFHSHPRGPQSFWAAPGIKTSGRSQLLGMCRVLTLCFSANHICQFSHFESVNHRQCWRRTEVLIPCALMSRIERKYCSISTSYLPGLFTIFILLHI